MKIVFVPKFPLHDHLSGRLEFFFFRIAWECEYIIALTGYSFILQSLENMARRINRIYSDIISNAKFLPYLWFSIEN